MGLFEEYRAFCEKKLNKYFTNGALTESQLRRCDIKSLVIIYLQLTRLDYQREISLGLKELWPMTFGEDLPKYIKIKNIQRKKRICQAKYGKRTKLQSDSLLLPPTKSETCFNDSDSINNDR